MRDQLRRFFKVQSGSTLPLAALSFVVVTGFAGLAVDVSQMYSEQARLQAAADAAALAAVTALPNKSTAVSLAIEYAEKNMPPNKYGNVLVAKDVEIGQWDVWTKTFTPGADGKAVRATAQLSAANGNPAKWHLARLFGKTTQDLLATAVAGAPLPCILGLDTSSSETVSLDSNARISAPNCEVHSNSSSASGLSALSNSLITSQKTCTVGGYVGSNSRYTPRPQRGCSLLTDPLASVPAPSVGACNHNNLQLDTTSATLSPGVYCGVILIKNNTKVTFNPGVYVIKNGELKVDSNASITGNGVGFYLTGGARLFFDSNSKVDLIAPSSGNLAGFIFFEDRSQPLLLNHEINSNNVSRLEGAIYLSRGRLSIDSNSQVGASSKFTTVVARQIKINSNARLIINTDYNASSVPVLTGSSRINLLL